MAWLTLLPKPRRSPWRNGTGLRRIRSPSRPIRRPCIEMRIPHVKLIRAVIDNQEIYGKIRRT
ncbi:1943_t:CDS:1, partial [Paraglomus occultum]